MNYRLLAIELGQLLKYDTYLKQIDRLGNAIFNFPKESYPNDAITAQRAQLIYDWIMTLANRQDASRYNKELFQFCRSLAPNDEFTVKIERVLQNAGFKSSDNIDKDSSSRDSVKFQRELESLLCIFDEQQMSSDAQRRGYILQDLLVKVFSLYDIHIIKSFTRNEGGEQIDGAFRLDSWYYITECRWRKALADIRELDGLKGQVDRSGRQTMGVFLSVNGWSHNVPLILKQNPEKTIILMDGYDFRCSLDGSVDLKDLITSKLQRLNLEGEPFYSAIDYRKDADR